MVKVTQSKKKVFGLWKENKAWKISLTRTSEAELLLLLGVVHARCVLLSTGSWRTLAATPSSTRATNAERTSRPMTSHSFRFTATSFGTSALRGWRPTFDVNVTWSPTWLKMNQQHLILFCAEFGRNSWTKSRRRKTLVSEQVFKTYQRGQC